MVSLGRREETEGGGGGLPSPPRGRKRAGLRTPTGRAALSALVGASEEGGALSCGVWVGKWWGGTGGREVLQELR